MKIENERMNRLEDKMNSSTMEEKMISSNLATIQTGSSLKWLMLWVIVIPVQKFQRI